MESRDLVIVQGSGAEEKLAGGIFLKPEVVL